jgi:hypothetical protein
MSIFYDTNAVIGYVFKWYQWHANFLHSFKDERKKYWSKRVKDEFYSKIDEMTDVYIKLLYLITLKLDDCNGFLTKKKLLQITNKTGIKHKSKESIIMEIWDSENLNFEIGCEELSKKIANIMKI